MSVALVCDIRINPSLNVMQQILEAVGRDDELMLDVLDATLLRRVLNEGWKLQEALRDAYSAWTVRDDGRGLVRRVDPTADAAYRNAISPGDEASLELSEAWSAMFGKAPNYSDAWDHAIKAMETVLVPVVAPNNPRATLGTVTTELEKGVKFVAFVLGPVETLGAMTRLAWPNPDRHGGAQSRPPEEAETSAVVHLAVTVVQWMRNGVIERVIASD
ncbi:hypothetical protein [Microbacterium sp. P05]|uniref:hypothetical protein n=1 Tax=Microbacterium sp. P05 TaxID=3366948 RepID=UPI0037458D7C